MPVLNRIKGYFSRDTQPVQSISQVDFDSDESIASFVKHRWKTRDQHRRARERQWFINIAYYLGYQYHVYNNVTGTLYSPPVPSWRVRLVCNRLMMISRKIVSKGLRQKPIWTSIPATGEPEDQGSAVIGTKALQSYWRQLHMDRLLLDLFTWTSTTGNCFMRVYWDQAKGPPLEIPMEDLGMFSPDEQQAIDTGLFLGDLAVDVCSPFEVDPDPDATRLEDATHLIHSKARSPEYLEDHYGKAAEKIQPDFTDDQSLTTYYERRIRQLSGPYGFSPSNEDEKARAVMTHSLWVNPCKRLPKGAYAVVAGDRVLWKKKDLPNPFKRIPYVHVVEIPVPGQLWGTCSLEQCIPLQVEYNRCRSIIIEHSNLMAKSMWLIPRGANIPDTALSSEPGERIEYDWPFKPEQSYPPPLPDSFPKRLEYTLKDIEDQSSIHEVTQARTPSGVRSGVAIAQLQEQDDQMLAPHFMMAERALSQIGSWGLELLAENITEDRIIRLVGKDRAVESMAFTGKSLYGPNVGRPGVNYFDVETQLGSQLPMSRLSRNQYVIDLVNSGILDRVQDKPLIKKALDLGVEEPVMSNDQLDRQAQLRENVQMAQGYDVMVNPWDDPFIHLEELRRFEKFPDFMKLAQVDQMLVQRFEMHAAGHMQQIQMMQAPAQMPPPQEPPEEMAPQEEPEPAPAMMPVAPQPGGF